MKILVTGGCGFIGRTLVPNLVRTDHIVRVLDNGSIGVFAFPMDLGVEILNGDVRDPVVAARATRNIDAVVHLAAQTGVLPSIQDPETDYQVNVQGTFVMLEAARHQAVERFIFASSSAVLGEVEPPIDESKPPRPRSPYGASKLAGEAYCSAYHQAFGLQTVSLRFANVYGPYSDHKTSVVAQFMRAVLDSGVLTIHGDGGQTRDFIHVGDLCAAINLALTANVSGETFQIATGIETRIADLAQQIIRLSGRVDARIIHAQAQPGGIRHNYSSIDKARQQIGFTPIISLPDGLTSTLEWYRQERAYHV